MCTILRIFSGFQQEDETPLARIEDEFRRVSGRQVTAGHQFAAGPVPADDCVSTCEERGEPRIARPFDALRKFMRLTRHEDGWIYGIFCTERRDPKAAAGDLSSAVAAAGIARTKDLENWERLPDLKTKSQQRNVVLHPEFVNGKYAFYTRPQDGFIDTGSGGGIGWALVDDIGHAEIKEETIIDERAYHTIKEVKNGEGPAPIKTPMGWLHLAHGVRGCAAGLRYVLYMYMTSLEDPSKKIASPGGYLLAPMRKERTGDVSNVLFSNGWIVDDDGTVYLYYASSDTRMHVAVSTVDRLVDYCLGTPEDKGRSAASVETLKKLIKHNLEVLKKF